jgi:hypothetical protein
MPFNVVNNDDRCPASKPYAVIGGRSGHDLFGCHPDKDSARKQQQALYAQTGDTNDDDDERACPRMDTPVSYTLPATVAW